MAGLGDLFAQVGPRGGASMEPPPDPFSVAPQVEQAAPAANIAPGPPTSPEEQQHRMNGWQQLEQRLRTDPVFQATVLRFGTDMLQPIPPGQTALGHAGRSVQDAQSFYFDQQNNVRNSQLLERRASREDQQLDLERQRTQSTVKSQEVSRRRDEQTILQNEKMFPATLRKLNSDIDKATAASGLDEAQAEFFKQRAKLYPVEMNIEMRKANAAMISAGKPTTYDMFTLTASAAARAKGLKEGTPEWQQEVDSQLGSMGADYFGRSGGKASAGTQTIREVTRLTQEANPKEAGESEEAYKKRISTAVLEYQQQSKRKDYQTQLLNWMNGGGADITRFRTPTDAQKYFEERLWKPYQGDIPARVTSGQQEPPAAKGAAPSAAPAAGAAAPAATRSTVTRKEVNDTARKYGVPPAILQQQLRDKGVTITEGE